MPTVLRSGPFRFFFYSSDREEPPHVHVERDTAIAKIWLTPVRIERSRGFNRHQIRRACRIVEKHQQQLLGRWNDYFSD